MFIGDVRRTWCAMYQRLDGFHLFSLNPISTKKNGDLGPGTHHHQHSIMVEGYSNHGNWIPVLSSLKIWHLCKVSHPGCGAVPHFLGAFLMRVRGRVHGRIMRASRTRLTIFNYTYFRETKWAPRINIPSTASKQALNGLFRGLWRRFIPHSTPRLRLVVPIVSET